jgi:glycosyltransferase involved in cell wall biosynthesis
MKNQSKITIISPSFQIGGIERTLSILANYFSSCGHQVTFVSCLSGPINFDLDPEIKIMVPSFERKGSVIQKALYRLRLVTFMRKAIKVSKAKYVLSMSDTFNPLVILAALKLPVNVYIGDVTKPDRKFQFSTRIGKRYLYPYATGFIAQTQQAAKYYRAKFGDKFNMTVINGSIKEITLYPDVAREKLIINVGRLSIEKGQDRMIKVFAMLKDKEDWKLGLTADGPLKSGLVELVKEKGLQDSVLFLGRVENLDMLYATAAIFALPSRMEGFPNALCEAMSAGLPSVSFDSFPVDEIITDGEDGFIIPDGDYNLFAAKLEMLIQNEKLRIKIGNRAQEIKDRLSIDKIGSQFIEFMGD